LSKKAPIFREEMNCKKYVKICKSLFYDLSVESPVDKSSREGIQGYSHYNTSEQLVWNASTVCPKRCG
jgi:hypothetical protein